MEILGLIDIPLRLLCILTFVFTIVMYTWRKRGFFDRLGIKAKPNLFLVGDLLSLIKKGFTLYDVSMVKKYGKVFGTFLGNKPVLVVTDADMIKQIAVKQFSNFQERGIFDLKSKPKNFNSALSVAEGKHWKFLRSSMSPCFSTGKLKQINTRDSASRVDLRIHNRLEKYDPAISHTVMQTRVSGSLETFHSNLQDRLKASPEGLDMGPIFRSYTLDVIYNTGFGMDVDSIRNPDNAFVRNAMKAFENQFTANPTVLLNFLVPDLPGLSLLPFDIVSAASMDFFREATKLLLDERKKVDSDFPDLLHTIVNAHKQDNGTSAKERSTQSIEDMKREGLSDDEVITNSLMFMLAAYETTWVTLSWLTYDLAVHTDCQEKLIAEIDKELGENAPDYDSVHSLRYLDMVVMESTRYHPVAQNMTRRALEEIDICGVTIAKGVSVLFPAFALHFMPEYWEDPMDFIPERFAPENKGSWNEYAYISFGLGPRNCIGMRLALLEVKMTIVSLLQKYRIVRTDKLEVPMTPDWKTIYKPANPVIVKFETRK